MSKRASIKESRRKKQELKLHLQRTIVICASLAIGLMLLIIAFLISIYSNELNVLKTFFDELSNIKVSILSGSAVLISLLLIGFYFFAIVALANYREFQREVASWWEIIITIGISVTVSAFFDLQQFIPLALTTVGCILVTVLLYILQNPSDFE
ncbi:MAG: hypothetical protein ACTSVY_10675 [Candidatus Helarchaeota archaeon]